MSRQEVVKVIERADQIRCGLAWVEQMTNRALSGGAVEWVLRRVGKSREQEKKFNAMITDIHRQCFRGNTFDEIKALMVKQFADEMQQASTPLGNPGSKVWDWKAQELVYVRPSTTKFRKHEAMDFIEFLHSVGAEYDVQWSEKALAIYDEMREARAA